VSVYKYTDVISIVVTAVPSK